MTLLRRYREHHDEVAREQLVRRAMPLVRSCARRYERRGETFEDLVQVGCVGLVKAIDRFDVDCGLQFSSYAVPTITGEIKRHFRDGCWAVHVPRAMKELDARVRRTRDRYEREHGELPSTAQIAEILEVSVEDAENATRAGAAFRSHSLEGTVDDGRTTTRERFGAEDEGYEQAEAVIAVREALAGLDDRERRILFMRYHRDMYQREIAERVGVSQMQVSRLIRQSLDAMGERVGVAA
jgi:RNA polymerase sigma-B factor